MPAYRLRLSLFRDELEIRSKFVRVGHDTTLAEDALLFLLREMNADKIIDRTKNNPAG